MRLFRDPGSEAKRVGASIFFADEASVRSDHHSGTTWAPVGRTPMVVATGARHSVNMISAITAKGKSTSICSTAR
jgi:hypothetical protein